MQITADQVKQLREKTGVGMMECKKALADSGGDVEKAIELVGHDAVARMAKGVAPYPLHRWREALDHAQSAGRLGTVKVAFDPRKRG